MPEAEKATADPQSYEGLHLNMRWVVGPSEIALPLLKDMVFARLVARRADGAGRVETVHSGSSDGGAGGANSTNGASASDTAGVAGAAGTRETQDTRGARKAQEAGAHRDGSPQTPTPSNASPAPAKPAKAAEAAAQAPERKSRKTADELLAELDTWTPSPVFDPLGASGPSTAQKQAETPTEASTEIPTDHQPLQSVFARLTSTDSPSAVEQLFATRNPDDGVEWAEVAEVLARFPSPEPMRTMYCYTPVEREKIGAQF